ncbi:FAD-dependent oxidoreductase [Runella sp. SP2]|uniref:FAD-dependent oxidoreductase n=1 Tax=Runella sp. SP2 TaxID=2268026 RepID=UPI000F09611B|nr:FAD-dependent oxidoreductase [Runella sp. SP2]AYQ31261.1 FAD-dependent oxidoreductase [Runella sp. SP2]
MNNYDVIIVGGGSMGLSTAYQLSKEKVKTLVLERFTFQNQLGSSAGFTRQFRIPYPEEYMVKLVVQSEPYWEDLQSQTKLELMKKVGTLWFGDPDVQTTEGNIKLAEQALTNQQIPYTKLNATDIQNKYHFKNLPSTYEGLFQKDGASINLKNTVETLHSLCATSPFISLKEHSKVDKITSSANQDIQVTVGNTTYTSKKLVLVPGPYVDEVTSLLRIYLNVTYWNMSSAYFKLTDPSINYPTWFVFQPPKGKDGNEFYGFPAVDWDYPGYIRVAPDFVINPLTDPSQRTSIPNKEELALTSEWVKNHMTGIDPRPYHTSTCFMALSNNASKELIVDFAPSFVPNHQNIVLYATGWAGKFIPLMGKILSDLTLNQTTEYDISHFKLTDKHLKNI